MNHLSNGVYGIVDVEHDPEYGAVGVLAFLTRRYGWFSPLYYLNDYLNEICVESVRSRWSGNTAPRFVRFIGTDKIYWFRGSRGIWHGRSRSMLVTVTHPTMRKQ